MTDRPILFSAADEVARMTAGTMTAMGYRPAIDEED